MSDRPLSMSEFVDIVGTAASGGRRRNECAGPVPMGLQPTATMDEPRCWAQSDNLFYGINRAVERLPPGIYKGGQLPSGQLALSLQVVKTDELVRLPDTPGDEVLAEIRRFRGMRSRLSSFGFLFKRNVLLWGPPGSGKTATVAQVCAFMSQEENGIAFYIDHPQLAANCLQMIRRIEPDRPVLAVIEDIDAQVERWGEHEYLALLDGETQINNIVTIATTNYPERLDRRFVDRPGRFSSIRYVGMPSAAARATYLEAKVAALVNGRLDDYVRLTDGFSIDYLRELIYLTQCEDVALEQAVSQLRSMMAAKPSSERSPQWEPPGFGASTGD